MDNTYAGRRAEAAARVANLPGLVGSEKQIAWANEIRASLMDWLDEDRVQMLELFEGARETWNLNDAEYAAFIADWEKEFESYYADMFTEYKSAAWWIRHSTDCLAVFNRKSARKI